MQAGGRGVSTPPDPSRLRKQTADVALPIRVVAEIHAYPRLAQPGLGPA